MSGRTTRAKGHRGAHLSLATSVAYHSPTISLVEALDALASQLLTLGWIVRMPRTAWDCQEGVLAVSARGFSPVTSFVQLDSDRHLSLVLPSGELEPVSDAAELVRRLRVCQASAARGHRAAVPA